MSVIVKSVFAVFSTIPPVSEESDAIIFSPIENLPTTCVSMTVVPVVPVGNTRAVAPEVLPVICTPPFE